MMPSKSKDRSAAIQPTRTSGVTSEYQNLYGATFEGRGMLAVFPVPAMTEANELHVVYTDKICTEGALNKGTADCLVELHLDKVR